MVLISEDVDDASRLNDALKQIDCDWYLGMDSEYGWRDAGLREVPFLFSISSVDTSSTTGNKLV